MKAYAEQNYTCAIEKYEQAIKLNHTKSMNELGNMYYDGQEVNKISLKRKNYMNKRLN